MPEADGRENPLWENRKDKSVKLTETQKQMLAVLFAAGAPLEAARLGEALELTLGETVDQAEALTAVLDEAEMPFELRRLGESYQLCTRPEYGGIIRRTLEIRRNTPLSAAAMEVLAVIAYNQPVTRSFVEQVRGVDSSSVVSSLVEKGLVEEAGRLELPGKPVAYRTTANFLRCFGLESLEQLPDVRHQGEDEAEDDSQVTLEDLAENASPEAK